ncbi:hypothetical protein [Propionicimonas sp.]|uniref:hypothetical protein n=1 Tax=Propionicimonas sp. TaxID=1955623 RepID=UPI0039E28B66
MTGRRMLAGAITIGAALAAPLLGTPTPAYAAPPCTAAPAGRDLNGDGFPDAAVGDPYATVDGHAEAGTVTVLFGDADGRIGGGARQVLTQADVGETPEAGDHFGWAVAVNRTDNGGCAGLVIGSPGEDVAGMVDAGMAHIRTFDPREDDPDAITVTTVVQDDVGGTTEAGDEFGYSVAVFGGSDEEAVVFAYGAPGENSDSGVVNLSHFTFGPDNLAQVRQGSRGVPGTPKAGDRFGEVVALANLDIGTHDPADDDFVVTLLAGAPGDTVSGRVGAGSVTAVRQNLRAAKVYTRNSPGVPGSAHAGDRFGASLSANILPTSRLVLVAVGMPGGDVGSARDAGSVVVLRNTAHKLVHRITLNQSTKGVPGTAEKGDGFGSAVAFRDDRALVVGVPGEDVGDIVDAGSAHVVRIGATKISLPYPTLTEDVPGTAGQVATGSRFGSTVAGLNSRGTGLETAFAISSPYQDGGSVYVVSDSHDPRSWVSEHGVRFGRAVG